MNEITNEMIFSDVSRIIDPYIELFSQDEALLALAAALHSQAIKMGGTKNPDNIPDGLIDENTLIAFTELGKNILCELKLLKALMDGKITIYCVNNRMVFSESEMVSAKIFSGLKRIEK